MMGSSDARATLTAALPEGYARLFDRAVEVLAGKSAVRALWLSGSLAQGTADAGSDLDLIVTVDDSAHGEFAAAWRDWLGEITPTVLAKPLPFAPGSFHSVTPGWQRLDVIVEKAGDVESTLFRVRKAVFDRAGVQEGIPAESPPAGPSQARLLGLIEEFFRVYGLLPVSVRREDWLLGVEGIGLLRRMLYDLFVEANAPLPGVGLKQWSAKLTEEQRHTLEGLPAGAATREAVIEGHLAVGAAFLPHAKRIASEQGINWPDRLEAATLEHLRRDLGIGIP
jgi:hypothetical protein